MATVRQFLDSSGFDWGTGRIVLVPVLTEGCSPGWAGKDECGPPEEVAHNDPRLDAEFDNGYGGPECPRYVAFDARAVYFPSQYDGATGPERVFLTPEPYLKDEETPYPGG